MNRNKNKGSRAERLIVDLLRSYGFTAYRVPLSGAAEGFKADVHVAIGSEKLQLESKCRGKGFARLYTWLTNADALVVKADFKDPLIIMPLHRLAYLLSLNPKDTREPSGVPHNGSVIIGKPFEKDNKQVHINPMRSDPLRVDQLKQRPSD